MYMYVMCLMKTRCLVIRADLVLVAQLMLLVDNDFIHVGDLEKLSPSLSSSLPLSIVPLSPLPPPPSFSDPKGYGKVSLSPQRRSFGSGCSWKDASSSTSGSGAIGAKDGQTISAPNSRDIPFETVCGSVCVGGW